MRARRTTKAPPQGGAQAGSLPRLSAADPLPRFAPGEHPSPRQRRPLRRPDAVPAVPGRRERRRHELHQPRRTTRVVRVGRETRLTDRDSQQPSVADAVMQGGAVKTGPRMMLIAMTLRSALTGLPRPSGRRHEKGRDKRGQQEPVDRDEPPRRKAGRYTPSPTAPKGASTSRREINPATRHAASRHACTTTAKPRPPSPPETCHRQESSPDRDARRP